MPYSVSVLTIESVARNLVIICFSDTEVSGTSVQLFSREISQATSSLTFSTRNSILETLDSILETRDSILETIESRSSRIEARGTVNLLLSGTVPFWGCTYPCSPYKGITSLVLFLNQILDWVPHSHFSDFSSYYVYTCKILILIGASDNSC